MEYVGKWVFDSIGVIDEEKGFVYLNSDEYLASPMPYVDENDNEAVEDEMKERKSTVGMKVDVCDDGTLFFLMPLPEGVTDEEVKEATESGELTLHDGMITEGAVAWEMRDGELWYNIAPGDDESWTKAIDENGFFTFVTIRFKKA